MTKDDIIKLAREAGYPLVEYEGTPYIPPLLEVLLETVRAAEREECAKLCEEYETENDVTATWLNIVAAGIRARGTT